jgi:hypothetical protein
MLFAMTVAGTPAAEPVAQAPAATSPRLTRFLFADPPRAFLRESGVCKGAGRMQTAYEPALLYRRQDGDRPRLLIEMPEASACLLGGVPAAATTGGGQ